MLTVNTNSSSSSSSSWATLQREEGPSDNYYQEGEAVSTSQSTMMLNMEPAEIKTEKDNISSEVNSEDYDDPQYIAELRYYRKVDKLRRKSIILSIFSMIFCCFCFSIPALYYAIKGPKPNADMSPKHHYRSTIALAICALVFGFLCWTVVGVTSTCHFYYYIPTAGRFISGDCSEMFRGDEDVYLPDNPEDEPIFDEHSHSQLYQQD